MKKMTTKTKYQIGSAGILFLFCMAASIPTYGFMKKSVTDEIYKETELFIATADATRTYVMDVLRPEMTRLLPPEAFIPPGDVNLLCGSRGDEPSAQSVS